MLVPASTENIKVTTPSDISFVQAVLEKRERG